MLKKRLLEVILGFSIVTMLLFVTTDSGYKSWKPPFSINTASNNSNLVVIWEKNVSLTPSPLHPHALHLLLFLITFLDVDKLF
jgi:hypothetical protein